MDKTFITIEEQIAQVLADVSREVVKLVIFFLKTLMFFRDYDCFQPMSLPMPSDMISRVRATPHAGAIFPKPQKSRIDKYATQ